jgi:hypothetical protein
VKAVEPSEERLENLCPSCFVPLKKDLVQCPHCKANFKERKKAFIKSLILPGWGDIYLGHRALGMLELLGSILVWGVVVTLLMSGEVAVIPAAVWLLLFYNGFDGLLTYHMAKKGYALARPAN